MFTYKKRYTGKSCLISEQLLKKKKKNKKCLISEQTRLDLLVLDGYDEILLKFIKISRPWRCWFDFAYGSSDYMYLLVLNVKALYYRRSWLLLLLLLLLFAKHIRVFYWRKKLSCRDGRPKRVYWAMGPVRGHLIIREQVNTSVGV